MSIHLCRACGDPVDTAIHAYKYTGENFYFHQDCKNPLADSAFFPRIKNSIDGRVLDGLIIDELSDFNAGKYAEWYRNRGEAIRNQRKEPEMQMTSIEWQSLLISSRNLINSGKEFWCLWNPASEKPIQIAFESEAAAWTAAEEMAAKHVGERFFVLHSLGHAKTQQPVVRIHSTQATIETATRAAKIVGRRPTKK